MNEKRNIVKFRRERALPTSWLSYSFLIRGKEIIVIVDRNITIPQRAADPLPFSAVIKASTSVRRAPEYRYIFSHESQPLLINRSANIPLRKYPAAAPVNANIMYVPASAAAIPATSLIQGPTQRYRYANITLCEAVTTGATNQNLGSAKNATICLSCPVNVVLLDDVLFPSLGTTNQIERAVRNVKRASKTNTVRHGSMLIANPMGLVATIPPIPPVRHSRL
ncbi:MAG: hypothetical protein BWZ04_03184 [Firmicutes bacterium ADurb.BinA205]|nr:MAG: hypothetical protein BWZ04_03184 [Firmicutes bacterium ADurb.BinA205]